MVDRARLFENLKRVRAWVRLDGAYDTHERAPRISQKQWAADYLYSRCISCGVCAAACPQFPDASGATDRGTTASSAPPRWPRCAC
jgi:succinate dehydrogenase / fumarate reductase iron-sulfur subunit